MNLKKNIHRYTWEGEIDKTVRQNWEHGGERSREAGRETQGEQGNGEENVMEQDIRVGGG